VSRSRQTRLVAALATALLAQAVWSVPATATGLAGAVSDCAHHCKKMRSLAEAGRCCGVDVSAAQPARLAPSDAGGAPLAVPVAVLPATPPAARGAVRPAVLTAALAFATGPPTYLRLLTLLV
jgi:hypothetical protein